MLNYLGQFPMLIGPAKLGSLISEHDDTLNSRVDQQLTTDIFTLPSVQVHLLEVYLF